MTSHSIKRLHTDLQRLRRASGEQKKDARSAGTDNRQLKQDRGELKRDVSSGKKLHATLGEKRGEVGKDLAGKGKALGALDAKRQEIISRYAKDGFDPLTPGAPQSPFEQAELQANAQRRGEATAKFDAQIAADRSAVTRLSTAITGKRAEIKQDRTEIKRDVKVIKQDRKELAQDRKAVHADRKKALADLRPAENQMGLKGTNHARGALGLGSVDHVLRAGKKVAGYVNGASRQITVAPVGNGQFLRTDAAASYKKLLAAAARAGISLSSTSGFRTMAEQQSLYRQYGPSRAAVPGYSNHQGGVAMDIGGVGSYGSTAFNWLKSHAGKFGFRNTVAGEPWHWSYNTNG